MAVHKRSYRGYAGQLTPLWSRFSVVTRYAFKNVFQWKLLTAFFVVCFFFPLLCAVGIYLNHSTRLWAMLGGHLHFEVDAGFFFQFLRVQGSMAFILTTLVGPGLVSPDLANSALPLYFCRPLSRAGYVVGKMLVLVSLLSLITWVPGLLLFLIQSVLAGGVGCGRISGWRPVSSSAPRLRFWCSPCWRWRFRHGSSESLRQVRRCWLSSSSGPASVRPPTPCCEPTRGPSQPRPSYRHGGGAFVPTALAKSYLRRERLDSAACGQRVLSLAPGAQSSRL